MSFTRAQLVKTLYYRPKGWRLESGLLKQKETDNLTNLSLGRVQRQPNDNNKDVETGSYSMLSWVEWKYSIFSRKKRWSHNNTEQIYHLMYMTDRTSKSNIAMGKKLRNDCSVVLAPLSFQIDKCICKFQKAISK